MNATATALRRRLIAAAESLRVRPLVAVGRVALWGAVAIIMVRGLVSLLPADDARAVTPTAAAQPVSGYPEARALAFAARFATDYLTYDEAAPDVHRARVSQYLADGVGGEWAFTGTQRVSQALAVDAEKRSPQLAVVTVAAQVGERWLHLAVPVAADDMGRLAVAASPTLTAGPLRAVVPKSEPATEADPEASARVAPALDAFFRAYATGTAADLAYYLAPGRHLEGLGGAVAFQGISDIRVGPGASPHRAGSAGTPNGPREAAATVTWATGGSSFTQTYGLRLVESDGRFYVDHLGPTDRGLAKEKNNDR